MLDVRDHQLLVLLFMMQAKGHDGRQGRQPLLLQRLKQLKDMLVDIAAGGIRFLDRRTRDQTTFGSAVPLSKRVVVRVKEVGILWVKGLVTWKRGGEEKGLPKP